MKPQKAKGQLARSLQAMSITPLILLGLVISIFSYQSVKSAMHKAVNTELQNIASAVTMTYDLLYPGDYSLVGEETVDFVKGNQILTSDFSIIDRLKAETQIDITIFYQDIRILTTICNEDGSRIVGTAVNNRISQDVLLLGQPHFYTNTTINDVQYFAYYAPLCNDDGSIVGMVYAGKPCTEVNSAVLHAVFPILIIVLCGVVIVSIAVSAHTRKILSSLQKIRTFLSKVSTGNLWEELDPSVLHRQDELSDMGYSALYMQRSLRNLVEQDTLTELNNRRFADKRLKQTQMQADIHGTHFVVVIGDIDFFKSVNDTYGHECGDIVLKQVATVLKKHMMGKGFVARWGGEEFLLLYDNTDLEEARKETECLLDEIRNLQITYDSQELHLTMTFGLAEGGVQTSIKDLLQKADTNLYKGKESGRNRVVV
ncbi:MAG: diguanylate cyclase [Lachnospiraceae bacterium]|nr:diguanylate cyclase [Lachnospiraceae bacterium]MBQ9136895.1 diguanylate cyclase [Lachnospiraceae bacterium]